jgi:hypothetical protein
MQVNAPQKWVSVKGEQILVLKRILIDNAYVICDYDNRDGHLMLPENRRRGIEP